MSIHKKGLRKTVRILPFGTAAQTPKQTQSNNIKNSFRSQMTKAPEQLNARRFFLLKDFPTNHC